ncbi:hypothetical protein MRX96_010620 [Rhipicephalus microplus]
MSTFAVKGQPRREETVLLLENLDLLHITSSRGERYEEDDFLGKNTSATVRDVLYSLFNAYDKKEAQKKLKNVWPVKLGETEKEFREAILFWLSTLKDNHAGAAFLHEFNSRVLLQTGTPRCLMFLTELSTLVLGNKLKEEVYLMGDAVPLGALKFSTKKNTCTSVALQAQQASDEEQCMEIESLLKQWESFSSILLRELGLLAENEMPDDGPTKKLELSHKNQTMRNEEAMTALQQAEEWLQIQGSLVPTDLIRDLQECTELSKHFFQDDEQKANGDQHFSSQLASTARESVNKSLEKIHAKRQKLEVMAVDIGIRLDEARKIINLGADDEPSDTESEISVSVQDLADELVDALMCSDFPEAPEDM